MRVDEVMSEDPVWVDLEATVGESIRRLLETHVHHLPVLKAGVVVGIVSDRDLRAVASTLPALREDPGGWAARSDEPIANVMSANVFSVPPDADLVNVVDLMLEHHVGAIPVLDPGSAKLLGIVSYIDVLRALRPSIWGA